MKKILSFALMMMLLATMLLVSSAFAADPAADTLVIELEDQTANADGTVAVPIKITANPGVAFLSIQLSYPTEAFSSAYEPEKTVSVSNGTIINSMTSGIQYVWNNSGADTTATGTLGTINMTLVRGAMAPGAKYDVTVTVTQCFNEDEETVPVQVTQATVTVPGGSTPIEPAECEHDFSVENKDAVGALKTAGNCQTEAVYYKSCSKCEAVSTSDADTFTGDKNMNNHVGTPSEWKTDSENTKHWKEYSCCPDVHVSEAAHKSTGSNAATCQHTAVCDDCEKEYGSVANHSYTAETVKADALKSEATCTAAAVYYKSCSACGHVEKTDDAATFTSGAPLDHDWTDWAESEPATCTDKGEESRSCKRNCGVAPETRDTDPLGHGEWIDYKIVTEATCGADGVAEGECGRCHNEFDDIVIPATGKHSWDEGKVTREATTEAEGEKTFTCTVCGQTRTEAIAKLAAAKPAAKPRSPKTGDESHLVVWAAVLLLACGGTAVVIARKKHN